MKVLLINEVCGVFSTGRICTDIAENLEHRGWESKIAYGRKAVPEQYKKYAVRIGNKLSVCIHAFGSRLLDNTGFYSYFATKRFIRWVKQYNPEVIHLHNLHGYYLHLGVLFEYLHHCGKPIVWTLHDCWSFTGHCSHYDYAECGKWKHGCYGCPMTKEYPTSLWRDRSRENYVDKKRLFTDIKNLTITTPSQWLKQQVEQSFLKEYPVRVVPNGIDLGIFHPVESGFREKNGLQGKTILLGVANVWTQRKGLDDFLHFATTLTAEYQLVLVGDLRGVECPENVLHIPRTNSLQELVDLYSAADVFLNFSYEETQGLTTVEALACGTPVVVYDKTAIPECVNDLCGVILERFDVVDIMNAIQKAVTLRQKDCVEQAAHYRREDSVERNIALYF